LKTETVNVLINVIIYLLIKSVTEEQGHLKIINIAEINNRVADAKLMIQRRL